MKKKINMESFRAGLKTFTMIVFELILALLNPFLMLVKHASLLTLLSWVALIMLSGKWTFNALSFSNTFFWSMVAVIAIEGAKNCLYAKKLGTEEKDKRKDLIVYIVFVTISIMASTSDLYGQVNKDTRESVLNSVEYQQAEQQKADIDKQLTIKESRLSELAVVNANKTSQSQLTTEQIRDYDAKIKAVNDQITSKKNELAKTPSTTKTNRLRNDIKSSIDELTTQRKVWEQSKVSLSPTSQGDDGEAKIILADMDKLNAEKRSINVTADNAKIEGGFGNIPAALSDFFWFVPFKLKTWMCIWTIFLASGIEFGMLRLYNKLKTDEPNENSIGNIIEKVKSSTPPVSWASKHQLAEKHLMRSKNDLEGFDETLCDTGFADKQTPQTVETKENIAESQSHTEFEDDKIMEYLNFMYANSDLPESIGITKIKKNTGLGEKARKIKDHLEYKKILKTDVTKTLILVTKDEAFNILFDRRAQS